MRSYIDGLLRYFEFSGRSTRMQYWMFALMAGILGVAAMFADAWLNGVPIKAGQWGPIGIFFGLVHFIPGVTVTVRRLHDIGRSGWWYFITLIPLVGALILLVWMCWPSEDGANDYGDHPADHESALPRAPQRYSTIPRNVRMGSNAARPPSVGQSGSPAAGRFI